MVAPGIVGRTTATHVDQWHFRIGAPSRELVVQVAEYAHRMSIVMSTRIGETDWAGDLLLQAVFRKVGDLRAHLLRGDQQ